MIANAQSMQTAQIKFISTDHSGAHAVTTGTFANLMYSQLISDVKPYSDEGTEKAIKHGKNYSCIKTFTPVLDVQCSLHFPRIKSIPNENFIMNIRFDIDSETLTGYSQDPEIQQMLLWNLSSGSFVL
jgi:hypothetical protein